MDLQHYQVIACPTTELSYTNKAILNTQDSFSKINHIAVRLPKTKDAYIFSVITDKSVDKGKIAFNMSGRKWANLMTNYMIEAAPYEFDFDWQYLVSVTFETDFASKRSASSNAEFDTDLMAKQFSAQFIDQALTVGQIFGFAFQTQKCKIVFELKVKELQFMRMDGTFKAEIGITTPNTVFLFQAAPNSGVRLIGNKTGPVSAPEIFSQDWDFANMGIGGLSEQFNKIFRRAFASRLMPPEFAQKLGEDFVKGMLLYGPPGTGKTLIARQIGKMLLSREPKIVNGPEVLNKYVGESEANIRKLFAEAEEEQARAGLNSGLHVIIFDEIDSICKARGNSASSSGVGDNVVNQLLSKIDGVDSLQNVLLIGMTNRRDLIDEALLRPGRLEVQVEVGLPNRDGRLEILKIHTKKLKEANALDPSVDLDRLADITKNYSGAEIAGLVRSARSLAINRVIQPDSKISISREALASIKVTWDDFDYAMKYDIKPSLGASEDQLTSLAKPVILWDPIIESIQQEFHEIIQHVTDQEAILDRPYLVCLVGEPCTGKTTLAANMAASSSFPFIRIYQPIATAGDSENTKIGYMKKLFDDAAKSELSCIVIDCLEDILDYIVIGPRFSNTLRTVFTSRKDLKLNNNRRMLVICTCTREQFLKDLELYSIFDDIIQIPPLTRPEHIRSVLMHLQETGDQTFTPKQCKDIVDNLGSYSFRIGIKNLQRLIEKAPQKQPDERVEVFLERMVAFVVKSKSSFLYTGEIE